LTGHSSGFEVLSWFRQRGRRRRQWLRHRRWGKLL